MEPIPQNPTPHGFWAIVARLQTTGGVAAVLATMVTLTLCVRYLIDGGSSHAPEYLTHAFATILGFYFGTRTVRQDSRRSHDGGREN
jgi:hypothetical protein